MLLLEEKLKPATMEAFLAEREAAPPRRNVISRGPGIRLIVEWGLASNGRG